jgi:D-alanyl-lipoteichoic acid acyltransferase DltB (MBOAT superfamily)
MLLPLLHRIGAPLWAVELFGAGLYIAIGRWLVRARPRGGIGMFALLNLSAVFVTLRLQNRGFSLGLCAAAFAFYTSIVAAQWVALVWWGQRPGRLAWLASLLPVAVLAGARYVAPALLASFVAGWPGLSARVFGGELSNPPEFVGAVFIGLSYLAFRTSFLVLEARNGAAKRPGLLEYLGFAFFAPTLLVGPISPFSRHHQSFSDGPPPEIPAGVALLRVIVGAVKCVFLGAMLNQLGYSALLLDGHPHLWVDLPVAAAAYYLYLYCNFSGFCDIAVGVAGLAGVSVAENFDNPLAARNVKDFWNRWHITLSNYMRDMVFEPLSSALAHVLGPSQTNQAVALAILVVFLLVGIWHGVGWRYAAFGAAHAIGVIANLYYAIALKKWLGKERFRAYSRSPGIRAVAVAITFAYVSATLFLFANNWDDARKIFRALEWR